MEGSDQGKTYVKTFREIAEHFGKSTTTIGEWKHRGMPGETGNYCLEDIAKWREATFVRLPEWENRQTGVNHRESEHTVTREVDPAKMAYDKARRLAAQADREEQLAKQEMIRTALAEGNYGDLDDMSQLMAEFLSEIRRLLKRIPVEEAAKYGAKKEFFRESIDARLDQIFRQMHDWLARVEELRIEP